MFGFMSHFYCPHCGHNDMVDVNGTSVVKLKGIPDKLNVKMCSKCYHKIAFKVINENMTDVLYRCDIRIDGNKDVIRMVTEAVVHCTASTKNR